MPVYFVIRGFPVPAVQQNVRDDQSAVRLRVEKIVLRPRPVADHFRPRKIGPESGRQLLSAGPARQLPALEVIRGRLVIPDGPQNPRGGHFGLCLGAQLDAPGTSVGSTNIKTWTVPRRIGCDPGERSASVGRQCRAAGTVVQIA